MGYMQGGKTKRRPLDDYPTPAEPVRALLEDLIPLIGDHACIDAFLEPFAGEGSIIAEARNSPSIRESRWYAIEKNPSYEDELSFYADDVEIGDSFAVPWPDAHVITNPPFGMLDACWRKAEEHRARHRKTVSVFMPCAWWHAEKRGSYTRPDLIVALGWRPVFVKKESSGKAHKGSQDFIWATLLENPAVFTHWLRKEKRRSGSDNRRRILGTE